MQNNESNSSSSDPNNLDITFDAALREPRLSSIPPHMSSMQRLSSFSNSIFGGKEHKSLSGLTRKRQDELLTQVLKFQETPKQVALYTAINDKLMHLTMMQQDQPQMLISVSQSDEMTSILKALEIAQSNPHDDTLQSLFEQLSAQEASRLQTLQSLFSEFPLGSLAPSSDESALLPTEQDWLTLGEIMGQASDYGTTELLRWCEANRQSASDVNDLTLMN